MSAADVDTRAAARAVARQRSATGPTPWEPTQELRFAVVLYGGVSLAIYINGVVQELLHLVRATAPAVAPSGDAADVDGNALLAPGELESSEVVYRIAGQLAHWRGQAREGYPEPSDPVATRFVVDIISGTSAGGINGVFLAKALANEQPLADLTELWIRQGELTRLLNDELALTELELPETEEDEAGFVAALRRLWRPEAPASLLASRRMYLQLLNAFRRMGTGAGSTPPPGGRSRYVDELDLWVTATDLSGMPATISHYAGPVQERRYRKVFRFVYGSEQGRGEAATHFDAAHDPLLAFAARATSSFPFAFEPMQLQTIDELVGGGPVTRERDGETVELRDALPGLARFNAAPYAGRGSDNPEWRSFFDPRDPDPRIREFGDGGYLDNKPFSWPTETLSRRHADRPVDRRLLYVEPDPAGPLDEHAEPVGPIANVHAAMTGLPRKETIREDVERLLERNRDLDRIARIRTAVADEHPWEPIPLPDWLTRTDAAIIVERGPAYLSYERLKVASILDDLAEIAARFAGFDTRSDELSAVRCFLQAWYDGSYPHGNGPLRRGFLLGLDVHHRLRRIAFLQDRIDGFLAGDEREWSQVAGPRPAPAEVRASLHALKRDLNAVFVGVRARARTLGGDEALRAQLEQIGQLVTRADLALVLARSTGIDQSTGRAAEVLARKPELRTAITDAVARIEAVLSATPEDMAGLAPPVSPEDSRVCAATRRVGRALERARTAAAASCAGLVEALAGMNERFEQYDSVSFPIAYGVVGEADRVEITRLSPIDAVSIRSAEQQRAQAKLAGVALGHFGGFLRDDWRRWDILWGRLDAAETILRTILPDDERTAGLVEQAQLAILEETSLPSVEGFDGKSAAEKREYLGSHDVARALDAAPMRELVTRGLGVTRGVLGSGEGGAFGAVAGVGRALVALVGAALAQQVRGSILALGAVGAALAGIGFGFGRGWLGALGLAFFLLALAAAATLGAAAGPVRRHLAGFPPWWPFDRIGWKNAFAAALAALAGTLAALVVFVVKLVEIWVR